MFGLSNKPTRLEIAEESISSLQHNIGIFTRADVRLRDQIRDLKTENEALCVRIEALEANQKQLRGYIIRMGQCFEHDKPVDQPLNFLDFSPKKDYGLPIVDHIHVNNDLVRCPPEECIYCHRELNTRHNEI